MTFKKILIQEHPELALDSGKTILDRYLESERKRIMEEMCPYDVPWLAREMGEERLMDKWCPAECEQCWGLPLKPEKEQE